MGSLRSFDGTEIVYDDWGADLLGVPIVLHHGFAASVVANWTAPGVVDKLLPLGRRIVALDARGHGRSGKPHDPAAYADGAMVKDTRALIDHLGVDRIDLVGYSMGAHVSLGVATEETRVRSVVLGGIGGATVTGAAFDRSEIADGLIVEDASTITNARAKGFRRFAEATKADRFDCGWYVDAVTSGMWLGYQAGCATRQQWLPIETAPRDGRVILVNEMYAGTSFIAAKWLSSPEYSGWCYDDAMIADELPLGPNPTHWFDVPPLPETKP